jgi:hypothetical protein
MACQRDHDNITCLAGHQPNPVLAQEIAARMPPPDKVKPICNSQPPPRKALRRTVVIFISSPIHLFH